MNKIFEIYLQFSAFMGLLEVKDWPNYCLIWRFIRFTVNTSTVALMFIAHKKVSKHFKPHLHAWCLMGVDSKMKIIKTQLRACFFPFRALSRNKFAEINSISKFQLLKVVIVGLVESAAQFLWHESRSSKFLW